MTLGILAWMQNSSSPSGGSFGPLSLYVNAYLTQVREQGYAVGSVYEQLCVLKLFGRWLERSGRQVQDLTEVVTCDFLRRLKHRYPWRAARSTLRRLLAMLRRMGVSPEAPAARRSPSDQLIGAYERFLLKERHLSQGAVVWHRRFVGRFLSEQFGGDSLNLSKLRAPDMTAFVQRRAHQHGPTEARCLIAAIRSFLRYLHYKGLIHRDLSLAVPKVARWSFSTVPKHLPPDQVREVLRHCDRNTALGRRDYAILLLLARLGLRAGEVVSLNLEDMDWENARITVCGKGGRWAQLPLPADVARAIAYYLRRDRPRCTCRRLFIRDYAPIGGFNRAASIASIVKRALARAGVRLVPKGCASDASQSGDRHAAQGSIA